MTRIMFLLLFILNSLLFSASAGVFYVSTEPAVAEVVQQDTLHEKLNLFYGRIWRDLYYMVDGDQYLFTGAFLPATVTLNGKTFKNVSLRYDIFKDEILTPFRPGGILQLNKEMVDSFSVFYQNKKYLFYRMPEDSLNSPGGYVNVIYKGKSTLFLKYTKKIDHSKIGGENEKFYLITRVYFMKGNTISLITGKSDLLKVLIGRKELIKNFIKKNKLSVSKQNPESYIPVIRYFDTISQ
jgi:hypothetical protein